jgi:hypothetical protein
MYARENSARRGSANSTHTAGSVAAALRHLWKLKLTDDPRFSEFRGSEKDIKGNIGQTVLVDYFKGLISRNSIDEQLANLKA